MENKCAFCGKPLVGRTDKKFCCDRCRNSYHNRNNRKSRLIRDRISAALNRNYYILDLLVRSGRPSASLTELEQNGFRSFFVTGHRKTASGHEEYSCYDILYCQTGSRIFRIRRAELF